MRKPTRPHHPSREEALSAKQATGLIVKGKAPKRSAGTKSALDSRSHRTDGVLRPAGPTSARRGGYPTHRPAATLVRRHRAQGCHFTSAAAATGRVQGRRSELRRTVSSIVTSSRSAI